MINLQTQETQGFALKKEHQNFSFLKQEIQIPSWLELEQDLNLYENPNPRNGPTTLPSYQPTSAVSPHMSATALLQKAAQMGSTSSSQQQQSMIMISGTHQHSHVSLDDSSTNNNMLNSNGNFGLNLSSCEDQMMNNSFSSSGFHGTTTIDEGGAITVAGGNDAFTRDFLGLRPLSDSDILSIAGMGNCMDSSNTHNQQNQTQKPWQGN